MSMILQQLMYLFFLAKLAFALFGCRQGTILLIGIHSLVGIRLH